MNLFFVNFLGIFVLTTRISALSRPTVNFEPIIGILAQQDQWNRIDDQTSLIGASYVKLIEAGGARVVPIFINRTQAYYESLLSRLNGVLLPGGSAKLDADIEGYGVAATHIYSIAKRFNDRGDYFPLYGICLGFESLAYQSANYTRKVLRGCFAFNVAYALNFTETGRLYAAMPAVLREAAETERLTFNIHIKCLTQETLNASGVANNWRVLTTNRDALGIEHISSFEHKTYPFYGTQFHPEKNPFEWSRFWRVPHSGNAIALSHYYARFFVNEARKSQHRFESEVEADRHLIYNFSPSFTGNSAKAFFFKRIHFEQAYFFNASTDYPKLNNSHIE